MSESKKLSYAVLHAPVHVPDMGSIGPTLSTIKNPTIKQLESMTLEDGFVTIKVASSKQVFEVLVPITSFTHMVVAK
jgi:hypothetical protein